MFSRCSLTSDLLAMSCPPYSGPAPTPNPPSFPLLLPPPALLYSCAHQSVAIGRCSLTFSRRGATCNRGLFLLPFSPHPSHPHPPSPAPPLHPPSPRGALYGALQRHISHPRPHCWSTQFKVQALPCELPSRPNPLFYKPLPSPSSPRFWTFIPPPVSPVNTSQNQLGEPSRSHRL